MEVGLVNVWINSCSVHILHIKDSYEATTNFVPVVQSFP